MKNLYKIKLTVVDRVTHMKLRSFFTKNYVLVNDILDLSTSTFELDITDTDAKQLLASDIMNTDNFVYAEAPESILNKTISLLYFGIIQSFKDKTLITDPFYKLLEVDIPIQMRNKKTSFKYRMAYEWLNLALNNVIYRINTVRKKASAEFVYNANYEPKKQADGHNRDNNGTPVFLIDAVPGSETDVDRSDKYEREEGYKVEIGEDDTFEISNLKEYITDGCKKYHYILNFTITGKTFSEPRTTFFDDENDAILSRDIYYVKNRSHLEKEDMYPDLISDVSGSETIDRIGGDIFLTYQNKEFDYRADFNLFYGPFATDVEDYYSIMNTYRIYKDDCPCRFYFSDQHSYIQSISVDDSTKNYNAVFFYTAYQGVIDRLCTTSDRTYALEEMDEDSDNDNKKLRSVVTVSGTFRPKKGGSDDHYMQEQDLSIPENVHLPLSIKHYKLTTSDNSKEEGDSQQDSPPTDEDRMNVAKKELNDTNDGELEVEIQASYDGSPYNPIDMRVGMWADIFYQGKLYKDVMLTGIEIDRSKSYYQLKLGCKRSTVYEAIHSYDKKGKRKK